MEIESKVLHTYDEVAEIINSCDSVSILTHERPDGDCLGAGLALCRYLRNIGKKANMLNSDEIPEKFSFLMESYEPMEFEEQFVISVDISDTTLLGKNLERYTEEGKIDLCIDHHSSNRFFAKNTYVNPDSSAACLIIYELLEHMGAEITLEIATELYTGIATDTGCFKFQNTTPEAHIAAAKLMALGVDFDRINHKMFDTRSRSRLRAESKLMNEMRFFEEGQIAVMTISNRFMTEFQLEKSELDALAQVPLTVEGVRFGYTIKPIDDEKDKFKVSLRTLDTNAAALCEEFGGGGHLRAAGCTIEGKPKDVLSRILAKTREYM